MNDVTMSDYEFDVATIDAALGSRRADGLHGHAFALSQIRPEVVEAVADFVFGAAQEECDIIRSLLMERGVHSPKLEMRLRYAVVVAPVILQADRAVWSGSVSEHIDRIADTNMFKCGGGLSLPTDGERRNASAIAFLLNNPHHDVQSFDPEDIRWIGQNMERLTPLAHLIHEVNMQSRSDMQRLLDAPAPALMEGIL
jgi:hypothetical protein